MSGRTSRDAGCSTRSRPFRAYTGRGGEQVTSGWTPGDVPNPPLQPNPAEPAETKLAPAGGQQESGVEQQSSKPSYPESGGKTYRFQGAPGDLGEVSQVASLKT